MFFRKLHPVFPIWFFRFCLLAGILLLCLARTFSPVAPSEQHTGGSPVSPYYVQGNRHLLSHEYRGLQAPPPTQPATTTSQPTPVAPGPLFLRLLTGQATSADVSQLLGAMSISFILPLIQNIANLLTHFAFNQSANTQSDFVLRTPESMTYQNPTIQGFWNGMVGVSVAFLLLVICWNSIQLMIRRSAFDYADAVELIPKMLLAFLASVFSLHFVQLLIDLNNAFCADIPIPVSLWVVVQQNDLLYLLVWFVYGSMGLFLVIEASARSGLLALLTVVGPVANLCWGTRETEEIARLWLSSLVACVFMQTLQVLSLNIGLGLLIPVIARGVPNLVTLLATMGIMLITLEIPNMLRQVTLNGVRDAGRRVTTTVIAVSGVVIGAARAFI